MQPYFRIAAIVILLDERSIKSTDQLISCADMFNVADKATVRNTAFQYRRPEFYSTISQCACVDNSTFETVMCKSLQTYVKACVFLWHQN